MYSREAKLLLTAIHCLLHLLYIRCSITNATHLTP